jgi:hypothetical protein
MTDSSLNQYRRRSRKDSKTGFVLGDPCFWSGNVCGISIGLILSFGRIPPYRHLKIRSKKNIMNKIKLTVPPTSTTWFQGFVSRLKCSIVSIYYITFNNFLFIVIFQSPPPLGWLNIRDNRLPLAQNAEPKNNQLFVFIMFIALAHSEMLLRWRNLIRMTFLI